MPRADWSFVGGMAVSFPPPPEQGTIVRFLDHMDRRIRRYIRAKQMLIRVLEEQKQVIVQQAITGQIDVRTGKPYSAYKDSGVEWLGDVPAHWEVARSKRLFAVRKELSRPGDQQLSSTQAYGVIPQSEYEQMVGRRVVKLSMHFDKRKHVEKDDFVISMRSFQGGLERAWASGAIRSSYVVLKPEPAVNVNFFSFLLKSSAYVGALQATAGFIRDGQDLTYENFCCVDLPVLALDEQREIADALATALAEVEAAIAADRRGIELLEELRTRLITDVVTGKLDVREAVANLPDETEESEPLVDEVLATGESEVDEAAEQEASS